MLQALSDVLTEQCWPPPSDPSPLSDLAPQSTAKGMSQQPFEGTLAPPKKSRVRVEVAVNGVTVIIPRQGVWRAAPWNYAWGRIYLAAAIAISAVIAWGTFTGQVPWKPRELRIVAGFMVLHLCAASFMVLDALSRGAQQAVLAVVGEELIYRQRGLLFSSVARWNRSRIVDLRPQVAALGVEGQKYQTLRILTADGKVVNLLEGYDPADLRWVATVLRRAIGLPVGEVTVE
jgi:hypothetical protein